MSSESALTTIVHVAGAPLIGVSATDSEQRCIRCQQPIVKGCAIFDPGAYVGMVYRKDQSGIPERCAVIVMPRDAAAADEQKCVPGKEEEETGAICA